jgi:hypothetical protein
MDGMHRGRELYEANRAQYRLGKRPDLFEHRYEHSRIKLLGFQDLPTLSRISSFATSFHSRKVEPGSVAVVASKLTSLETAVWTLSDNERKFANVRQQSRYGKCFQPLAIALLLRIPLSDFAQALKLLSQPSLKAFVLEYYHEAPMNHSFALSSALHSSSPSIDHLSTALYTLTQAPEITEVRLSGPIVISPSLFWPSTSTIKCYWPRVQQYHVTFSMDTPDGDWYFIRQPNKTASDDIFDEEEANQAPESDSDSEPDSDASEDSQAHLIPDTYHPNREKRLIGNFPSRRYRTYPNDEKINPLLKAMARAAACMPSLQNMSLGAELQDPDSTPFEMSFIAAGTPNYLDRYPDDVSKPRLYWETGAWRPDEEVLTLWKQAIRSQGKAGDLMVKFLEH